MNIIHTHILYYKAKPKEERVTGIVRQTLMYESNAQYMQHEITAMPASSDSSERHNNHCKGISITETTDNNIVFKQYPIKETRKTTIPIRELVIPGPGYDTIRIGYPNTYSTVFDRINAPAFISFKELLDRR